MLREGGSRLAGGTDRRDLRAALRHHDARGVDRLGHAVDHCAVVRLLRARRRRCSRTRPRERHRACDGGRSVTSTGTSTTIRTCVWCATPRSCSGKVLVRRSEGRGHQTSRYRAIAMKHRNRAPHLAADRHARTGAGRAQLLSCQARRDILGDGDRALKSVALPLATIVRRHVELLVNTASNADAWRLRLKVIRHDLTSRELEVAARMLAGEEPARDRGLPGRRAFQRDDLSRTRVSPARRPEPQGSAHARKRH